jgi:magnesium transporter
LRLELDETSIKNLDRTFLAVSFALEANDFTQLFADFHAVQIAEVLVDLSFEKQILFFNLVSTKHASYVLGKVDQQLRLELLEEFSVRKVSQVLAYMDVDDAADVIADIRLNNEERAQNVIAGFSKSRQNDLGNLLQYSAESAGGKMSPDFIGIPENLTVDEALSVYKQNAVIEGLFSSYLYILNVNDEFVGVTSLRKLVLAKGGELVKDIREDHLVSVFVDMDQEEVAQVISSYDLSALPVLNSHGVMLGVVTIDDIVDVITDEATEDLLKLSGSSEHDESKLLHGSIFVSVKARFPWLFLTLFGGMLSGLLIQYFSSRLTEFTLPIVVSFIPLLMGMGGNAGNQTATIIVRGLGTKQLREKDFIKCIVKESFVGVFIGVLSGLCLAAFCWLTYGTVFIAYVLTIAMILTSASATLIGSLLPIILEKFDVDPAVASAPFLSTAIDLAGLAIYFSLILGLANIFL